MSNRHRPGGAVDVRRACLVHRKAMFRACYRILGSTRDAEDATQEAIANAIANPPRAIEKDWPSWLCGVAQNAAREHLRKEIRARRTPPAPEDAPPDDERREEVRQLLAMTARLMSEEERTDFALYEEVALTDLTQEDLAEKRALPLREVQRRRRKALRRARDAVVAAYLVGDPGSGASRCAEPQRLAQAESDSPALRKTIMKHVRGCTICRTKRDTPNKLLRRLWVLPGLGFTGDLLARLMTPKKVATTAVVTLAAVSIAVFVREEPPAAPESVIVPPSPTEAAPPRFLPSSTPTRSPQPPAPPEEPPPAPPAEAPVAAPATETSATREVSAPTITGGWLERQRLAIRRCDNGPRTSDAAALVNPPDSVRSVTAHLRGEGRDIAIPMYDTGMSAWVTRIGPFDAPGRYDVVIVAIGANGVTVEKRIGELRVIRCS